MLEKRRILDQVELKWNGIIFVQELNQVLEDGVVIMSNIHRTAITPLEDVSKHEYETVRAIAGMFWNDEVKKAYAEMMEKNAIK